MHSVSAALATEEDANAIDEERMHQLVTKLSDTLLYGDRDSKTAWELFARIPPHAHAYISSEAYGDMLAAISAGQVSDSVKRCQIILNAMRAAGLQPDIHHYELAVVACRRAKNAYQAYLFKLQATQCGIKLSRRLYKEVIGAFGIAGDPKRVLQLMREMTDARLPHDKDIYLSLTEAYAVSGRPGMAETVVGSMEALGLAPDERIFAVIMGQHAKLRNAIAVRRVYDAMMSRGLQPSVVSYTTLIDAYYRAGEIAAARQAATEMHLSGLQPDVVFYGAAIAGEARLGYFEEADRLLDEMNEAAITPNDSIADAYIYGHAVHSSPEAVGRAIERMNAHGFQPTAYTLSSLLHTCAKAGKLDTALTLLKTWKNPSRPSSTHYTLLIKLWGEHLGPRETLAIYRDYCAAGFSPTIYMFNILLDVALKARDNNMSDVVLAAMVESGVQPDTGTYTTILKYSKDRDLQRRYIEELLARRLPSSIKSCQLLLSTCARNGDAELAATLFKRMQSHGFEPDVQSWTTLIHACGKAGRLSQMEGYLKDMRSAGYEPNVYTYTCLLQAYLSNNDIPAANHVLERFGASGLKATAHIHSQRMKLVPNDPHALARCLQSMRTDKVAVDNHLVHQLFCRMGATMSPATAIALLDDLRRGGVNPDLACYTAVMRICARTGTWADVQSILDRLIDEGVKPNAATYRWVFSAYLKSHALSRQPLQQLRHAGILPPLTPELLKELFEALAPSRNVDALVHTWSEACLAGFRQAREVVSAYCFALAQCGSDGQQILATVISENRDVFRKLKLRGKLKTIVQALQ
ncbi:hypothetical protein HDU85_000397 [Gaertneriomyces sp. JEL0708]|nr:hypothetical protein HDU85_000397 [Gaertneriomyces sp. JEL0708]